MPSDRDESFGAVLGAGGEGVAGVSTAAEVAQRAGRGADDESMF